MSELTRLKARNEELEAKLRMTDDSYVALKMERDCLKAENEQYWALAKQHQEALKEALKSSQKAIGEMKLYHHNAKEEVYRLTASLAAAQEKLRESSGLIKMLDRDRKYPSLDEHLDKVKEILSDKDGQAAFEKWKRMEEALEIFACGEDSHGKNCKTKFSCCKAREALDGAKGGEKNA